MIATRFWLCAQVTVGTSILFAILSGEGGPLRFGVGEKVATQITWHWTKAIATWGFATWMASDPRSQWLVRESFLIFQIDRKLKQWCWVLGKQIKITIKDIDIRVCLFVRMIRFQNHHNSHHKESIFAPFAIPKKPPLPSDHATIGCSVQTALKMWCDAFTGIKNSG